MKILIVHNDYGKYSGEEAVVDKMVAMLGSHGYDVVLYRLSSAGRRESLRGRMEGFACGLYSPAGVRGMREALRRERPDVVNVHNLYPFISPAALFECRKAGVPVVMTVHNFRLVCPTGLFMRDGRPCEECLERGQEWGCVRHNCEHSLMKSAGYALRNAYARWTGAYKKNVDAYACITGFQRRKLVEAGYDERRISVIPNFLDKIPQRSTFTHGEYVAFCGRLSSEKGIDMILKVAQSHPEIPFKLAGEQRMEIFDIPENCELIGYLSGDALYKFYENAAFFVMPSRWYEGFPMAILEAACHGKATVGPDHGGFTEIIGKGDTAIGSLFRPNDIDDLERTIVELWDNPSLSARLGERAYEKVATTYNSSVVFTQWESLLEKLIAEHSKNNAIHVIKHQQSEDHRS